MYKRFLPKYNDTFFSFSFTHQNHGSVLDPEPDSIQSRMRCGAGCDPKPDSIRSRIGSRSWSVSGFWIQIHFKWWINEFGSDQWIRIHSSGSMIPPSFLSYIFEFERSIFLGVWWIWNYPILRYNSEVRSSVDHPGTCLILRFWK